MATAFISTLKNSPRVIFTTAFYIHRCMAFKKVAIEGFELDAFDYLLKPISFQRFLKAVNRVMETTLSVSPKTEKVNTPDQFIQFKADLKMIKIFIDDTIYRKSERLHKSC